MYVSVVFFAVTLGRAGKVIQVGKLWRWGRLGNVFIFGQLVFVCVQGLGQEGRRQVKGGSFC